MSMAREDQPSAQSMREKLHNTMDKTMNPPTQSGNIVISTKYKEDPSHSMLAVEWHGKENMQVNPRPAPDITDAGDAIVRVTTTLICGSDLHMYYNQVPGGKNLMAGDILGHEAMGVITKLGPAVTGFNVGDRVVISAPIACGQCEWCQKEMFSLCDNTNPSSQQEMTYGHRLAGIFGYTHMTGGIAGGQAEYVRVPIASVNMLKVPNELSDEQVVGLSDILPTGYHGTVLAEVDSSKTVAIWGCGPVGLMGIQCCAQIHKAKKIIAIDNIPERLELAKKFGATDVINFSEVDDVLKTISKLIPYGPDCAIDYVGYRYPKTWSSTIQNALHIQSDSCDVAAEAIWAVKKGGNVALIGDYFMTCNGWPIGAQMEKAITTRGGQLYCQKYWKFLLKQIQDGVVDIRGVFSHRLPLREAAKGYDIFAEKKDHCTKVMLKTDFGLEQDQKRGLRYEFGKIFNTEVSRGR